MKYLFLCIILLATNCNKSNTKIEKEVPKEIEVKTKEIKEVETKKLLEELLVTLKDGNDLEDARSLVVNSGLVWDKMTFDTDILKVATIKVPLEKKDFWVKRLQESNVFSNVKISTKEAIESIKYKSENTYVSLRKTYCSGVCPVYDVTFFKDRKVIFNGIENVLLKGKQEFEITENQQEKLLEMFSKTNFKAYSNSYVDKTKVDFPSTFITHQNRQVEIKLWKNVPDELAYAYEYLEGILLDKKLIE